MPTLTRRLLLALPLLVAACATTPQQQAQSRRQALDAALQAAVDQRRVDAVAMLAVGADGQVLYSGQAGNVPQDALWRLASMTKPLTSVTAMTLVEEGRLRLDDPVSRYVPEFGRMRVLGPDRKLRPARNAMTIRDLLRHTSGLSYNFLNVPGLVEAYARLGVSDGLAAPELTTRENMRRLSRAPLQAEPGTLWAYSLSTDVLGAVIERVTGKPLDQAIQERVTGPLGMRSFAFHVPTEARPRMAQATTADASGALRPIARNQRVPYPLTKHYWISDPERQFSRTAYPSGGAGSTAGIADYARFARMMLNGGELDGVRILRPETVAEMTRAQTGGMPITLRGPGYDFGYGFSVVTDPAAAKTRQPVGTYSWGGIYGTGFWIDPANRQAIVVMTQTPPTGGVVGNELRETFYTAGTPGG